MSLKYILLILAPWFPGAFTAHNRTAEKALLRIGLLADVQYADCEPGPSRYYRQSLGKLQTAVRHFNREKVDFTVNLGDLIDRNQQDMNTVLNCLKKLKEPIYHLTGNHDYKGVSHDEQLYKQLGMPEAYYAFEARNWTFIMLNTNELATYSHSADTAMQTELALLMQHIKDRNDPQGASYNGGISSAQKKWLETQLQKCQEAGRNVLVFSHHPLYPRTAFAALNHQEIIELLDNYSCVKAVFCGHHHAGAFGRYGHVPVITVEGMVETAKENAYGIIELYPNRIMLKGQGRTTSREIFYQ